MKESEIFLPLRQRISKGLIIRVYQQDQRLIAVRLVQMPIAMSGRSKHPNSNVHWLRRRTRDIRALFGEREEKRSLQTRDPAEAKQREAQLLFEFETRSANLRARQKAMSKHENLEMVVPVYDR